MRLRDISMLVAALSLPVLATASLLDARRPQQPVPVTLSVEWPERPQPPAPKPVVKPPDEEFRVIPLGLDGQSGSSVFAVQRRLVNPVLPGEPRWTLTFYSLTPGADERSRLKYLGSRCVEYDMGPDEIVFDVRHWAPEDLRKAIEKAHASAVKQNEQGD